MPYIRYDSLIVIELCNGTLHDIVVVNKDLIKFTSYQLRNVVLRQIVEGVKYLHDNNILHFTKLHPHNIFYRIDPLIIKLAHFGCSRTVMEFEGRIHNTHHSAVIKNGNSLVKFSPEFDINGVRPRGLQR